jgi:hypothetical protein
MANEPGFVLNESIGGINWGNCQAVNPNDISAKPKIKYMAIIETSDLPRSGTR